MCLFATTKRPYTAKRDLTCYKAIRKSNYSRNGRLKYEVGRKYHTEMLKDYNDTFADGVVGVYGDQSGFPVGAGFHSTKTIQRLLQSCSNYANSSKIAVFIIPKGSKYYLDDTGLVVSDTIIYKEDVFSSTTLERVSNTVYRGIKFRVRDKNGRLHHVNPEETDINKFKTWER